MKQVLVVLVTLLFLSGTHAAPASADEPFYHLNRVVQEGQRVENVFLYGEDGIIAGVVEDEVVVINGNLTLTKTARIRDRVFLIGGQLNQEQGAAVGKGIFHINLVNENLNSLLLGAGAFVLLELAKLALALYVFLAGLISLFVLKNRVNRAKGALQSGTVKVGLLGFFGALGLGLVFLALVVTVWGIPLALLLGLLLLILLPVGLSALSLLAGELLLKNFAWGQKPFYQVLIGSLFLVALFNFPVLGVLWGILVLVFALGAVAASLLPGKGDHHA